MVVIGKIGRLLLRKDKARVLALLDDPDPKMREKSLRLLLFPNGKAYFKRFVTAMQDSDKSVRRSATVAMLSIAKQEHIPQIVPLLEDDREEVRRSAAQLLKKLTTPGQRGFVGRGDVDWARKWWAEHKDDEAFRK